MRRCFCREDIADDNKPMKRWSTPSVIREMQIETPLRCHFTSIRLAKIKKTIIPVDEGVERLEPLFIAGGNITCCRDFGKKFGSASKYQKYTVTV